MTSAQIVASGASAVSLWISTGVAAIPVVAAISSATIAARSARSVKRTEAEAQRIRDLENRISGRKYEMYQPIIEALGNFFDKSKAAQIANDGTDFQQVLQDFKTWVSIYGSDDSVMAFRNFMQATYNDPPSMITGRLVAEFILAARRDIGYPDTKAEPIHVFGIRISDIHHDRDYYESMTLPFEELCAKYGWEIPWRQEPQRRALSDVPDDTEASS